MAALTVGMATYDDFDGVWFTIQALRLYQDLTDVELLVVDNYGCDTTRDYLENWTPARYVRSTQVQGTAAPRDVVFQEATGDAVLCCDSHVLFEPGVVARLKQYYAENPASKDLLQGPLVFDDLGSVATHFAPEWRAQMWGTWDTDPRGVDPDGEPFDIPMQGLGAFTCRRDAWLGFHPRFAGFGGEEGYIHEKFRQAGHRTLCVPWLRWSHRFGRPKGPTYRNTLEDRLHNYLIGHSELGLDLTPIVSHFSAVMPEGVVQEVLTQALWPEVVATPSEPDLADAYEVAAATPSDINEHVPFLRGLAERCEHVTEFGTRGGVSTTALAMGRPSVLKTYDVVHDPSIDRLRSLTAHEGVEFRTITADVLAVDIEETDLLFIDTRHTAAQLDGELGRHAARVRRWIALHDTETFGERGEDGGPGLLPALRRFLHRHPEWSVMHHSAVNNGFTVLTRDPTDPRVTPPFARGDEERDSGFGDDADVSLPLLVAICPTYKRRRLVENAIACFLAQDYPSDRRRLLVLDDFGDLGNVDHDTWSVVSQSERLPSLPSKYSALAEIACTRWPAADALVIWEDDDVYLPGHLQAHARALASARWSKPSRVLSTYGGTVHEEPAAGRFFASLAVSVELFRAVGGFVDTGRGDFDQQFLARLEGYAGPPGDPTADAPPTYVFRWQETGEPHGEHFMTGPDDETWYDRAGAAAPAPQPGGRLVPALDRHTRHLVHEVLMRRDAAALKADLP